MLSINVDSFHEITKLSRDNSVILPITLFLEINVCLKITDLYYIVDFCVEVIKFNKNTILNTNQI